MPTGPFFGCVFHEPDPERRYRGQARLSDLDLCQILNFLTVVAPLVVGARLNAVPFRQTKAFRPEPTGIDPVVSAETVPVILYSESALGQV